MRLLITPARRPHSKDDRGGRCWTPVFSPAPGDRLAQPAPPLACRNHPSRLSVQAEAALPTTLARRARFHRPECV